MCRSWRLLHTWKKKLHFCPVIAETSSTKPGWEQMTAKAAEAKGKKAWNAADVHKWRSSLLCRHRYYTATALNNMHRQQPLHTLRMFMPFNDISKIKETIQNRSAFELSALGPSRFSSKLPQKTSDRLGSLTGSYHILPASLQSPVSPI